MSSSSGDEYSSYRKLFPLHDAAEAGDMEALARVLHPNLKNASAAAAGSGAGMDVDGGLNGGASGKVRMHARVFSPREVTNISPVRYALSFKIHAQQGKETPSDRTLNFLSLSPNNSSGARV